MEVLINPTKEQLVNLKNTYQRGVKVMASEVDDVKFGTMGFVCSVYENGNILVAWESGVVGEVKYRKDKIMIAGNAWCTLGRKHGFEEGSCNCGILCSECGWNNEIAEKRKEMIRAGMMVKRTDGTRMLKVPRKTMVTVG